MQSINIRVDPTTHRQIAILAEDLDVPVDEALTLAVRGMRQEVMGRQLSAPLTEEEVTWLDADLR